MKKYAALLLAVLMAVVCLPALAEESREVKGNMVVYTTAEDFALGELSNVKIDETIGNGAVVLDDGQQNGYIISDIIGVEAFEYMVASWNTDTPAGTWVEVSARAYVDMKDAWTKWLSWGKWSQSITRGSVDDSDDHAYMDVDTFTVSGSNGETASKIQIKVVLHSDEAGVTPTLRLFGMTWKNTLEGQITDPAYYGEEVELPERVQLDTPAYSQMIRERSIGDVMCSATTVCVMLNDRGEDTIPEEIALIDYDKPYDGFGNWSYSVAAAGAYGYEAYTQYADLDIVRQELAKGYSVGLSVTYSNSTNGSYPYLEGGAANNTAGHLITITGYETVDGVDYLFSSDSAAGSDDGCVKRYRADQMEAAWKSKIAYIIHDKEEGALNPNRIACELVPSQTAENAYALVAGGETVKLSRSFTAAKLKSDGNGIVAYYVEGEKVAQMPETTRMTTANERFKYGININEAGELVINPAGIVEAEPVTMHIFVMVNNGTTYTAELSLEPAVQPTQEPVATQEPAVTEEPVATQEPAVEPTAPQQPAASDETGANSGLVIALVVVGAAAVATAAVIVLKKKKAKQ